MSHFILYNRELITFLFLRAALWVAPKKLEYYIAIGLKDSLKDYADLLGAELER